MAFAGGAPASLAALELRLAALEAFAASAPFNKSHIVTGVPNNALGNDGDIAFDVGDPNTSTGLLYVKAAGVWISTTFQAWTA